MKTTIRFILPFFLMIAGISNLNQAAASTQDDEYTKNYEISGVEELDISIACELYIAQGDEESLKIEAEKNIFHRLKINQKNNTLYIESDEDDINYDDWDVEVYITVKELKSVDIGGAVKMRNKGILKTEKLSLEVSGAADIELEIDVEKLTADFSGAVNAELEGRARYIVMDMSGASKVDAEDLICDAFYLDFSGFGKAEVYAEKVLKVDMSGMGVVRYSGHPGKIETESSGLGVIKSR